MITLDASVVIAHLNSTDLSHRAATACLRANVDQGMLMHSLNLAEVLVGGVRAGRGQELLADLQAIGIRPADRVDGEPLRLATLRAETGLKLPDCCALDTAMVSGSALATFDSDLLTAARRCQIPLVPDPASLPTEP